MNRIPQVPPPLALSLTTPSLHKDIEPWVFSKKEISPDNTYHNRHKDQDTTSYQKHMTIEQTEMAQSNSWHRYTPSHDFPLPYVSLYDRNKTTFPPSRSPANLRTSSQQADNFKPKAPIVPPQQHQIIRPSTNCEGGKKLSYPNSSMAHDPITPLPGPSPQPQSQPQSQSNLPAFSPNHPKPTSQSSPKTHPTPHPNSPQRKKSHGQNHGCTSLQPAAPVSRPTTQRN